MSDDEEIDTFESSEWRQNLAYLYCEAEGRKLAPYRISRCATPGMELPRFCWLEYLELFVSVEFKGGTIPYSCSQHIGCSVYT